VSFDVPIINDVILENNEEFTLNIIPNTLPNGVSPNGPALITILDDDSKYIISIK